MKIVTAAEMREIDRVTSERYGVPSLTLMENAGTAVAEVTLGRFPQAERVTIICGKGNNGGDGFVEARKLREAGRAVTVVLLADPADLKGDAAEMFERMGDFITPIVRTPEELRSDVAQKALRADVLVDAILGTGFRPPVTGLYADAIRVINAIGLPVLAVDIPSGADADAVETPVAASFMARADAIITFTAPRPAHVFARLSGGPTFCSPIGSPEEAVQSSLNLEGRRS